MKKSIYLIAALCLSAFSSCSSDGDPASEPGQEQTARIELNLLGSGTTRAVGTEDPVTGLATNEATVSNIVIGIFNGENVVTIQSFSDPKTGTGDANKNTIICPLTGTATVTCSAVVVGNVPDASITTLKSATTKTAFLAGTISLVDATAPSSATSQSSAKLPMSADVVDTGNSNATTFSLTPGAITAGLSVELVRMVSRITLTSLEADFSGSPYPNATFKLQRVFLRDAIPETKVTTSSTASDAMSGSSYLTGGGTWSGGAWSEENAFLYDDLGTAFPIVSTTVHPDGNYYWFYAFANDGSTKPTAFVIQGVFDTDGETGTTGAVSTVFYPVIVNKKQPGTTIGGTTYDGTTTTGSISRNQLYNLSVTLKNIGADNATDNISPANLEINVSVAAWPAAIAQDVEFN